MICHLASEIIRPVASMCNVHTPRTIPPFQRTKAIKMIKHKIYGTDATKIDGNTAGRVINILRKSAIYK